MNDLENILNIKFPDNCNISNITNNSKKVKKDSVFFGLCGKNNHGSKYSLEALKLGASFVVHDDEKFQVKNSKVFFVKNLEDKIIQFLNSFYKNDINNNNFFTFTGTNGKTSSAFLCHQLLLNMEYESIYIGTIGVKHNNSNLETSFSSKTTPDIFELFEIINSVEWSDESLNICIEISSHALDQKRLKGINWFNSSSLMNIKDDHLDYHKDISSYRDAKFSIFKTNSPVKLIHENISDFSRDYEFVNNSDSQLISISNKNNFADIYFNIKTISINSSEFYILINNPPHTQEHEKGKKYHFKCNLFPEFNITNLVFTICSIGFDNFSEHSVNDLSFLNLPKGRTEFIKNIPDNIVIDYAHNEEAIEFILKSLSNYFDNLVVVFGCGGNRDKNKRSKMLRSAIENSTNVIFTSDNLRNETFEDIFIDAKGDNKLDSVIAIEDRREAIIQGTKMIKNNDCLVVLGKGHENFQETNSNFIKFSDHEVINEIYS